MKTIESMTRQQINYISIITKYKLLTVIKVLKVEMNKYIQHFENRIIKLFKNGTKLYSRTSSLESNHNNIHSITMVIVKSLINMKFKFVKSPT